MRRDALAHLGSALCAALVASGLALWIAQGGPATKGLRAGELATALVTASIGWLLAHRRPDNRIGWLLLVSAFSFSFMFVVNQTQESLWIWLVWAGSWIWMLGPTLLAVFALLLFPTGHPPSRRWRVVGWTGGTGIALMAATSALMPFEQSGVGSEVENPIALTGAADALEMVFIPAAVVFLGSVVAAGVSLVVRFRRSGPDERHQIKWVAYAAVLSITLFLTGDLTTRLPFITHDLLFFAAVLLFLGSIAVSILRYRLYDIDRIVSRTISYALVTTALAATYASVVFGPVLVLGRGSASEPLVAAATLAVAALFRPVRARVQGFVDRRFDRARYDTARTLESFASRLRNETDIDDLGSQLRSVVQETMQPAHVSLWVKDRSGKASEP